MGEVPSTVSYGVLIECLQNRISEGWTPEDHCYFNELAIQLVFAQRGVLRQVSSHLQKSSWFNGWSDPFVDRLGLDY